MLGRRMDAEFPRNVPLFLEMLSCSAMARRKDLIHELEALRTVDQAVSLVDACLKRELKARLADTKTLLRRHISGSGRLVRSLLEHPLQCEAVNDGDRKEYRVTGTGTYASLLPEPLSSLSSPEKSCSLVRRVPNRTMNLSMSHLGHLFIPFSGEIRLAA